MRTPNDETITRAQVEEITKPGRVLNLTQWERKFINQQARWIEASPNPWWHPDQAAKIEQIWKERVK